MNYKTANNLYTKKYNTVDPATVDLIFRQYYRDGDSKRVSAMGFKGTSAASTRRLHSLFESLERIEEQIEAGEAAKAARAKVIQAIDKELKGD